MFWSIYSSHYQKEKKEAIDEVYSLGMGTGDVAYLLDLTPSVVKLHLRKQGIGISKPHVLRVAKNLNYRDASQIYEAQDLGFSRSEISQLLDRKENVIDFAIANRYTIGSKIIEALRISYGDEIYDRPYKSSTKN